jgi:hypothetical protein
MACNITNGFTYSCADAQGGIDVIYITNGPVEAFTETAGEIQTITVGGNSLVPADWIKFETPRQTSSLTETITPSQENGTVTYQQDLVMVFNKMSAASRNEILLMAQNQDLIVAAKDNNGVFFSIGIERGAYMTAGTSVSGVAYADRNGYELTVTGMEKDPMYTILPSIIEA